MKMKTNEISQSMRKAQESNQQTLKLANIKLAIPIQEINEKVNKSMPLHSSHTYLFIFEEFVNFFVIFLFTFRYDGIT